MPSEAPAIAAVLASLESGVRDPATSEPELAAMAHQQQVIYRQLGRNRQLADHVRTKLPQRWRPVFDQHIGARRALQAMNPRGVKPATLPAWRIRSPEPAEQLLAHYRKAQRATGIAWEVLAAVNLIETGLGRIDGVSSANAQGPMQFLPTTWAQRGIGHGDIRDPHDAIQAAARYLVRRGGLRDIRRGLWGYNNSAYYGRAVLHYAALLKADPQAFRGLYHWQIHLLTSAGDVWLPEGSGAATRLPVAEHLRRYPWSVP
ncbi:MAG: lytic transglycosylase domain-containing protein [Cyanobacteriota bacterium]|nr:lytic transglycosylase domain-containing protein [Cyanobacteriota bacterium]